MKCTITREQLLDPVLHVERVAGKGLSAVLSGTRLEVQGSQLSLTATNLEIGLTCSVPVQGEEDGVVVISGSVLAKTLGTLPSGAKVSLSDEGGKVLTVSCVGGVSRLTLLDTNEFPTLPQVTDGVEVVLPAKTLRDGVTSVAYCASPSTIKPELASVFVHPGGDMLVTAATDSFRLAERRLPLKQQAASDPFLIPSRSTAEFVRTLEQAEGDVVLRVSSHQLSLTLPQVYLTLRLTSGTFPDYTQIIPKEYHSTATMLAADIERVLRKASVFANSFNMTNIAIEPKQGEVIVHTENAQVGETTDTIPATVTGDALAMNFNHKYVSDALVPVHADSVVFSCAGPSQPVVVRPLHDESFLYLVMPMNR